MTGCEKKDGQGKTPLIKAALSGDIDAVCMLLDQGANVKARDMFGRTPLIAAAATPCQLACLLNIVRLLLDYGSDINAQNTHGRTALMEAVSKGGSQRQREMIQLLLSRNPDISLRDKNGRTALTLADAAIAPLLK